MLTVIFILITIACALLVLIILAQSPKGGLASQFGGSVSQILGARQAPDALEKGTWYFGIGIIVAIAITYFMLAPTVDKTEKVSKTAGADYHFAQPAAQQRGAQQQPQQGAQQQPAPQGGAQPAQGQQKPATGTIQHGAPQKVPGPPNPIQPAK